MSPTRTPSTCLACQAALEPAWKLCPFCGWKIVRAHRRASAAELWRLWQRYHGFVREGLLPVLRSIAAAQGESLEARVESWKPQRYVAGLAQAMRRLGELADDTRLPAEFRRALRELGEHREHEAHISQTLSLVIYEMQGAIQGLIDAGDIDAGILHQIGSYIQRRDRANTFEQIVTMVTGIDSSLVRIAARALSAWLDSSVSNARERRWEAACLALASASDELIDRAWDHLARRSGELGLRLRGAEELRGLVEQADSHWRELAGVQAEQDGRFEQALTRVHAFAGRHRDAHPVLQLLRHAELLAEVRGPLIDHWARRVSLMLDVDTLARAQEHFLRLVPGDGVLAFFATTVFVSGKAGLALTTSSVQWFDGEQGRRFGYAQLRDVAVGHEGEMLVVGRERVELTSFEAEAAAEALRACVRLSIAAPGPAVCACGGPGCWLRFGQDEARCAGCGGAVHYS